MFLFDFPGFVIKLSVPFLFLQSYGLVAFLNTYKPSVRPFCGTSANSAKPDQTPQNAASDQVLHCLLTKVSF